MASPLTDADVRRVAELARLTLSPDDVALFTVQLGNILAYAETINEADTSAVAPTSHPLPAESALRDDESRPCLDRERALANAPDSGAGLFKVPKVL
ncbi:MAG TPA: Asp-tRNA(Asn)/Glu-tRNA(Gln) amidotransferase subunit GatC [Vicinamibacterales bacterium]|nr:Asp-tRNA(Asn)/Glu-tRNA(Gln) amidotransferase subunit GatC [Vicinamibacterales bacterium]